MAELALSRDVEAVLAVHLPDGSPDHPLDVRAERRKAGRGHAGCPKEAAHTVGYNLTIRGGGMAEVVGHSGI